MHSLVSDYESQLVHLAIGLETFCHGLKLKQKKTQTSHTDTHTQTHTHTYTLQVITAVFPQGSCLTHPTLKATAVLISFVAYSHLTVILAHSTLPARAVNSNESTEPLRLRHVVLTSSKYPKLPPQISSQACSCS